MNNVVFDLNGVNLHCKVFVIDRRLHAVGGSQTGSQMNSCWNSKSEPKTTPASGN